MPSSLAWAHQDVDDLSPDTLTALQNTFGHNGTQDINVTKILAVQQKLQPPVTGSAEVYDSVSGCCRLDSRNRIHW